MTPKRDDLLAVWVEKQVEGWTALSRGMRLALGRLGVPDKRRQVSSLTANVARVFAKARLMRRIAPLGKRRLVTLSWARDSPAFPDGYWCEIIPWIFDCWGPEWPEWERLLRRHRVSLAFFTAKTPAEHFARTIPGLLTHWLPEAMELSLLHPGKPLAERSVHVFEMGRKMMSVHERISEPLESAAKNHLYDPAGPLAVGAVLGMDALYRTMGDSSIMICYPKSMTNPEGAGGVETVTQRYLEAIGSGSLVVGSCPKELEELLGFNPVIELSEVDPAEHLLSILDNLQAHQILVDRARVRLHEVGSFDIRAATMLRLIEESDRITQRPDHN